jgi:hypothetical protein
VKEGQKVKKGDALIVYHLKISDTTMEKKKLEVEQAQNDYDVKLKGKRNDVLQKQREIKNILDAAEKKIAQLQLKKLQREYKEIVAEGKSVKKKQKEYDELVQKRKSATLRSKYAGTAVDIKATVGMSASEDTLMTIRDKKDFLIEAVDADGSTMRYNMTVDVRLGVTSDKIKHHIKGKVISTDNLESSGDGDMEEGSTGSQLIRISKKDRYKYDFDKYNVYVTATSLKIEDALLVEEDAVNEESEGENGTKYFVYVVENDKLHKRYIVSNYHQDGGCYLVNQGLEEGQTLAILSKN